MIQISRIDMRTVVNKSGVSYDASDTDRVFAEDVLAVKEAIDDATTGINTEQIEVSGTTVIDSSGDVQTGAGVVSTKDKKQGSNCSGSSGDTDRVLTLSNSNTTQNVIVIVDGAYLIEDQDYSVNHKSSGSEVTFTNQIWDDQYIEVIFWT